MRNTLPTLTEVQNALSEQTGYPPETFAPDFKLLDCGKEIERMETLLGVTITVRNYIKATVAEVMEGMSLASG